MPVIIPPDHAQVTLDWNMQTAASGSASTVLGFFRNTFEGDLQDVAATVRVSTTTFLTPVIHETTILGSVRAVSSIEAAEEGGSTPGGVNGALPAPNTGVLVSQRTAARGRRGRGRNYWPTMVLETEVDDSGNISAGKIDVLTDAFADWWNNLTTVGLDLVVLQHTTPTGDDAPANPTPPITPPPIVTSLIVQGKVATQRRRLRP